MQSRRFRVPTPVWFAPLGTKSLALCTQTWIVCTCRCRIHGYGRPRQPLLQTLMQKSDLRAPTPGSAAADSAKVGGMSAHTCHFCRVTICSSRKRAGQRLALVVSGIPECKSPTCGRSHLGVLQQILQKGQVWAPALWFLYRGAHVGVLGRMRTCTNVHGHAQMYGGACERVGCGRPLAVGLL